jgi:hypothetical protein
MSKTNAYENGILGLLFNAVAIADIAENDTTTPNTYLFVSFHTADPGEAGVQGSNETSYGAYARVSVIRTTTGWKVTGNTVYPRANIAAPTPTSGSGTLTYFGVGQHTSTTAGALYYSGAISPPITITTGGAPTLVTGTNITED